jgi:hypothetical protein
LGVMLVSEPDGMERTRRPRRLKVVGGMIAILFVAAAGVGGIETWRRASHASDATRYARQACEDFRFAEPGSTAATRNPFNRQELSDTLAGARRAANNSASAAKRSARWNALAEAYSALLQHLAEYQDVVDVNSGDLDDIQMSQQWHGSYNTAVAAILLECRKATVP